VFAFRTVLRQGARNRNEVQTDFKIEYMYVRLTAL
jgi:hypothetical protein